MDQYDHGICQPRRVSVLSLAQACPLVPGATVSKPVLNVPEGKVIVFAMYEGQTISEHRTPFVATVLVFEGLLRFAVADQERDMGPGDYVAMPTDAPHRLLALRSTLLLLTLFKRG